MLLVTAVCYGAGWLISRQSLDNKDRNATRRWTTLVIAVSVCLATLGFFKYWDFAVANLSQLSLAIGGQAFGSWGIVLPVGISFFTFQALTYCVDVYRGDAPPARSFIDFACYIAMFPQLVAGPIVRYSSVAGQLVDRRIHSEQLASGIALFCIGFAKKILLANTVGEVADVAFRAESLSTGAAWWGAAAYALQIYFDFSAYSDMAVGLGRMLGFEFLKNFHAPYRAESITDFWRRWHISLSSFLRDYLYIPLGGNRLGARRTYVNLITVMLFGGLWHGANWTFIAWGAWHGSWLAFERWNGKSFLLPNVPKPIRISVTFGVVLIGWVLFRADNLGDAALYLRAMLGLGGPIQSAGIDPLLEPLLFGTANTWCVIISAALVIQPTEAHHWSSQVKWSRGLVSLSVFGFALFVMFSQSFSPFLYFQF
jgi:alginate O-acetyltransferase complex protein AlgI